jgi:hypothetical protein
MASSAAHPSSSSSSSSSSSAAVIVVIEAVGTATAAAGGSGLDLSPLDRSCFFGPPIPADCSSGQSIFENGRKENPPVLLLLLSCWRETPANNVDQNASSQRPLSAVGGTTGPAHLLLVLLRAAPHRTTENVPIHRPGLGQKMVVVPRRWRGEGTALCR